MAGNPLMGLMQGGNGGNTIPAAVQNLMGQQNAGFGPFGNMLGMLQKWNEFKKTCNMTPQQAEQKVKDMLNSGQINQQQIDQAKAIADMLGIK